MNKGTIPRQSSLVHIRIKAPKTNAKISMKKCDKTLYIYTEGAAQAETILQYLPLMICSLPGQDNLQIDFSKATSLSNLAISSILVLLRKHSRRFTKVRLQGMENWALDRLKASSEVMLFGPQWSVSFGPNWAELEKGQGPSQMRSMRISGSALKT